MTAPTPPTERRLEALATVALTGVTASVGIGLGRLLINTSFVAPALAVVVVVHGCTWAIRRRGWPASVSVAVGLSVAIVTIAALRYGDQSIVGLPNGAVLEALGADLSEAWAVFQDEGAPAPVAPGFVVAAMSAMAAIALISDALAFRVGAPMEALAPAGGLFLFTTVLSGPDHRITATLLFLTAALLFVLSHRVARRAAGENWVPAPRGRGAAALLRSGAALAMLGLLGGLVLGPALPGADAEPVVDLDGEAGGARVTLSPLVDIQSHLVEQPDVEVFTVRADERAYWRLTALDRFDGTVWSAGGEYVGAEGPLPLTSPDESTTRREIRQEVRITALADIWLPAAFEPAAIDAQGLGVEWNAASSSLVVEPGRDSSDDMSYTVVSSAPEIDRTTAAASPPAGPDLDPLRQLPDSFSPSAARAALAATEGATTPFEQALALQNFFRSDFQYSLDVPAGHGVTDIDDFLELRVGYCEQFSGSYAALARSIGLPARVAVGFTPGEVDPDDPSVFRVRGEHAHAWPEVYLEGPGWVAFEPTPGRGAPGAETYTGVDEQQQGETAPGIPAPTTTVPSTQPAPDIDDLTPAAPATTAPAPAEAGARDGGRRFPFLVLGMLAVVALAWSVLLPAFVAVRQRYDRWRASGRPAHEVTTAWRLTVDSFRRIGVHRSPAETPLAFGRRAQRSLRTGDPGAAVEVADAITAVWFGDPTQVDTDTAADCAAASSTVRDQARGSVGPRRWWLSALDPRRLSRQTDGVGD